MLTNSRTILIEWGDCDPAGIVYFPQFFAHFDRCTFALFARAGIDIYAMKQSGEIAGIPMADTRCRFLASARYGDKVRVQSSVAEFRRASFDVEHRLIIDGELCVEGFETRIWCHYHPGDGKKLRAERIPHEIVEALSKDQP